MKKNDANLNNFEFHKPVLLQEMLENLKPTENEIYLDCTFGAGGYSAAILQSADCYLYAIDRDENAKKFATKLQEFFPQKFVFLSGEFSKAKDLLAQKQVYQLDGIVLDIGVSSMQFDDKERGFSFDSDAKLDMRMDQKSALSAFEVVNDFDEEDLFKIIKEFGEEPKAKLIAKKIVQTRRSKMITSCRELADIVRSLYFGYSKTDPATRTFQALRIFVNQELEELKQILNDSIDLLKKGGRLIVVSFHSLEDVIVKNFLKKCAGLDEISSRYEPLKIKDCDKIFHIVNKSAIQASAEELQENIRARSAKMRVAVRL